MKKSLRSIITVLLTGALAVGMTACGESSSSSANESTEEPPIQYISEYEESDDSELDAAIKQSGISNTASSSVTTDTESTGENNTSADFQTGTFTYTDNEGYQYQVTLEISPWINISDSTNLNAAWDAVSNGNSLPSLDSFKNQWQNGSSVDTGYYAVGQISIDNITDGFNISADNPASVPLTFLFSDDNWTALEVFYSTPKFYFYDGLGNYIDIGKAAMKSDHWGPVPFVIVHGEFINPNYPNGQYHDTMANDSTVFLSTGIMPNGRDIVDVEDPDYSRNDVATIKMTLLE